MLFPASWIPVVINEAVPETITGSKAIAIRITNIRQIQGFIFPPFSNGASPLRILELRLAINDLLP
jgi:hypothetical protein